MLHLLATVSAARTPSAPAVAGPDGELTYGDLDATANRIARALAALGVRTGDRVALWLDKSARTVATTQAVLRLGAAYVPIDPLNPIDRAATMIRDCAPGAVVTNAHRAGLLGSAGVCPPAVLSIDAGWDAVRSQPTDPLPDPGVGPDDLAYILYTSGSTGVPKGVCLSHRNALAFVDWAADELAARPDDRFANHAPLHFDLSVLDLYVAFRSGASVHLIPNEIAYAPRLLVQFIESSRITVWYSVPSALILMVRDGRLLDASLPALRAVLFAGEPYPIGQLRRLRNHWPAVRFLNLYGPTETNVCTYYEVGVLPETQTAPVPIGRACSGDRVWLAGFDGRRVAPGEEGEVIVDGPTVMLGYWGHPPQGGRPYATGDRAILRSDGELHYLGRRDGMVKIRGYRVDLGDVDNAMQAHPGVAEVATVVHGEGVEARLVAYVVPVDGHRPGLLDLKKHCAGLLPRHMIVDVVYHLDELPRTRNGKVDRRALVAMGGTPRQPAATR